jgi:hypothetical protein
VRIELTIEVLQTSALPLGYRALALKLAPVREKIHCDPAKSGRGAVPAVIPAICANLKMWQRRNATAGARRRSGAIGGHPRRY